MESGEDTLSPDAELGRVALGVRDRDRLIEFYDGVVGLDLLDRRQDTAVLGAGGDPLVALEARPAVPARGADETGLFHAAIRVPTRAALGEALARIEDRWELTGASDHLVSEALYLDDPAGNGLEIYRDRSRDEWPIDDTGRVAMETRPLGLAALRELGTETERLPAGTDVGHVHLEVSDLAATRRFYTDGLGMGLRQRYGSSAIFLAAGGYHHHVGANVWNGRTEPGEGLGLDWFEVCVPSTDDVEAARRRFDVLGETTTDLADGFAVTDADGIELRLRAGVP